MIKNYFTISFKFIFSNIPFTVRSCSVKNKWWVIRKEKKIYDRIFLYIRIAISNKPNHNQKTREKILFIDNLFYVPEFPWERMLNGFVFYNKNFIFKLSTCKILALSQTSLFRKKLNYCVTNIAECNYIVRYTVSANDLNSSKTS